MLGAAADGPQLAAAPQQRLDGDAPLLLEPYELGQVGPMREQRTDVSRGHEEFCRETISFLLVTRVARSRLRVEYQVPELVRTAEPAPQHVAAIGARHMTGRPSLAGQLENASMCSLAPNGRWPRRCRASQSAARGAAGDHGQFPGNGGSMRAACSGPSSPGISGSSVSAAQRLAAAAADRRARPLGQRLEQGRVQLVSGDLDGVAGRPGHNPRRGTGAQPPPQPHDQGADRVRCAAGRLKSYGNRRLSPAKAQAP
jgi:hypothetical protein